MAYSAVTCSFDSTTIYDSIPIVQQQAYAVSEGQIYSSSITTDSSIWGGSNIGSIQGGYYIPPSTGGRTIAPPQTKEEHQKSVKVYELYQRLQGLTLEQLALVEDSIDLVLDNRES